MTSLKDQVQNDLTDAMRSRDQIRTATLRMVLAGITKAEVAGKEHIVLSDDDVLAIMRSEIKKRNEAAELYETGNRPELAASERAEAAVISTYMPAAMPDSELATMVADEVAVAQAAGVTGPKAMGVVIKAVRTRAGNAADGTRIAAAVKTALGL